MLHVPLGAAVVAFDLLLAFGVWRITNAVLSPPGSVEPDAVELDVPAVLDAADQAARLAGAVGADVLRVYWVPLGGEAVRAYAAVSAIHPR